MNLLRTPVAVVVFATVLATSTPGQTELEDGRFTSSRWKVQVDVPTNWQPTEQTAYPNVLLWMQRRDPKGVMLLTAEPVEAELNALNYAKRSIEALKKLGFNTRSPQLHSTTGATLVDFERDDAFLRQAFLVVDEIGYSLTLSAESSRSRGFHLRAFDETLRNIRPLRRSTESKASDKPPSPPTEPADSADDSDDSASTDETSERSP